MNGRKQKKQGTKTARPRRVRMAVPRRAKAPGSGPRDNYRRLITDPCNANLVPTPYQGPLAGSVRRNTTTYNTTTSNGAWFYHPTYGLYGVDAAGSNVAVNIGPIGGFGVPGGPARAIAGCVSTTYSGSESTRAGLVTCGVVPGSVVAQYLAAASGGEGNTLTILQIQSRLTEIARVPVDRCEVNWFPGEGDSEVKPDVVNLAVNTQLLQAEFADVNFIAVAYTAVPAGTMFLKCTGVVEQMDDTNIYNGTPWTVSAPSKASFNWRDVLAELSKKDTSWYINTFKKVGQLGMGLAGSYATMGLPGALGYLTSQVAGMRITGRDITRTNR